eukprot:gene32710-39545_t
MRVITPNYCQENSKSGVFVVTAEIALFSGEKRVSSRTVKEKISSYITSKNSIAMSEVLIPRVNTLLILDNEGQRLFVKYYDRRPKTQQNELILTAILDLVFDTLSTLLKGQLEKRVFLDNLELVLLTIDEALDDGRVMELDSAAVVNRVLMKGEGGEAAATTRGGAAATTN